MMMMIIMTIKTTATYLLNTCHTSQVLPKCFILFFTAPQKLSINLISEMRKPVFKNVGIFVKENNTDIAMLILSTYKR